MEDVDGIVLKEVLKVEHSGLLGAMFCFFAAFVLNLLHKKRK